MFDRRDWNIGVQDKQYSLKISEISGWRSLVAGLISSRPGWCCNRWVWRFFHWTHRLDGWEYNQWKTVYKLPITLDQAREISPDFVAIFEEDDESQEQPTGEGPEAA